ncbi:MAG TPA: MG2 domain-containing protein, partial [bacterium]|nr:MG2 domain-containing protein [bacterium]
MNPNTSRPTGNRWFFLAAFFAIGILAVNGWRVFSGGGEWAVRAMFIPGNGAEVGGREKIYWRFDKPLFFEAETPFALPTWDEVPGTFSWTAPGLLVFSPLQDWPVGRNFRIAFPRDFPPGCNLKGPGSWQFSSAPTELEEAGQVEVDSRDRATLLLGFNSPVDPRDLPDCLTVVSGSETALEWRALDRAPGTKIRIITGSIPPGGEELELRFRPPALPGETDEKPVSVRRLSIEHLMVLREVEPSVENGKIVFEANFSQIPSLSQASDYLTVEPPLPVTVGKSKYCWRDNVLALRGDFEPGRLYTIRFREGLPAASGRRLEADQSRRVRAPDLPPSIRFLDPGSILAAAGTRLVGLEAINIPSFRARLKRIYPNNLVQFMMREKRNYSGWWGDPENEICAPAVDREYRAGGERNQPLRIDLDLGNLAGDEARGVFVCELSSSEERAGTDQRLVMITDIGLSARLYGGEVLVWVNSVLDARPMAGARVTVLSTANRALGTGTTDDRGTALVTLDPAAGDRPFLLLAETDRDLACLVLEDPVSCAEKANGQRPWPGGKPESFLETDRGVYRGGETVRWYAVVRTDGTELPPSFPVQVKLADPDGREMDAAVRITGDLGTAEGGILLPAAAPSGGYRLSLHIPGEKEALGETRILVADFVPPRLEASVEAGKNPVGPGETATFTVAARYLYGAPAAGNRVRTRFSYRETPLEIPGREDWRFGDRELSFTPPPAWEGEDRLNPEGEAAFPFDVPADLRPGEGLAADCEATVMEEGGRGLTVGETITIRAYPRYVGIRGLAENESLDAGADLDLEVALFSPGGELLGESARVRATLEEIVWESLLKKDDDGRYRYVSERRLRTAGDYEINLGGGISSFPVRLPGWGRYLLRIQDPAGGAPVSVRFHGIGKNREFLDSSLEEPERVDLSFDRADFSPGETPELCIRAPFPGKALVTVEADRLLYRNVLILEENCAAVPLPVPADVPPGSRCFVSVLRPLADRETPGPRRACGSLELPLKMEAHHARIEIEAPAQAEPGEELCVKIRLTDENGLPATGEVLITAVDRGILDLTEFGLPDPYIFFYEPHRESAELFDVYNRLLPERSPGVTAIPDPGGGDCGLAGRLNPVPAVRFKP